MNELYTKLAQKIVYSSLWGEDGDTCKVWVTILALKDHSTGILDKNITGIARIANLPIEVVEKAFNKFMSPDPLSSSPENEGRRISKVDGGYMVLNHEKYVEYGWSDEKKEYERLRKAGYRGDINNDSEIRKEKAESFKKPTLEQLRAKAVELDMPATEGDRFFNFYESKGWKVGKSKMISWPHSMANWKKNYESKGNELFKVNDNANANQLGQYGHETYEQQKARIARKQKDKEEFAKEREELMKQLEKNKNGSNETKPSL